MSSGTRTANEEPIYPPRSHALRDLPFELVALSGTHYRAPVDLDRGLAPGGVASVGAIATVVDVLAGSICARAVAPDWMATSALSLHLASLPGSGTVIVDAGIARLGRTTLVIQISLRDDSDAIDGQGALLGDGLVSFSRLPRRDDNLDITKYESSPGQRTSFALAGSGLVGTFEDALGTVVEHAALGVTTTPVVPYVQNSFGAVNGGIVAAIAERAARLATAGSPDVSQDVSPCRTTDLSVHYLSQVRSGAVRTRARVLRSDPASSTVRVELFDAALEPSGSLDGSAGSVDGSAGSAAEAVGSWAPLMAVAHIVVARATLG